MNEPQQSELEHLVDVWWRGVQDFTQLMESLPQDLWSTPTDLDGWDVHAVAAHMAHLEAVAAGRPHDDDVEIGDPAHVRNPLGSFTEQGVVARRGHDADALINELRESATARHTAALADPPKDPEALAPGPFGAIGWNTRLFLRNRPVDVFLHEQDVRRAVGQPGNHDSPAAVHTVDYLSESLAMVWAKRAQAPDGAVLRLEVSGHEPRAFRADADHRGHPVVPAPEDALVTLSCDREVFLLLAGGRGDPAKLRDRVQVSGDVEYAEKVLGAMAVTP